MRVCAHPRTTAGLLCNFTGPHLMLKMDMDKTIVTEGRATVQRWCSAHMPQMYTQTAGAGQAA